MKLLRRLFNIGTKKKTNPPVDLPVDPPRSTSTKKFEKSTETYIVYCILGKVDDEKDKLQYLSQWMECAEHVSEFLIECKTKTVSSEQSFQTIQYWEENRDNSDPNMITKKFYTPIGGILTWNNANNQKICKSYLPLLLNEIEQAKKEGKSHQQWLQDQFPKKNMTIKFNQHEIRGRIEKTRSLKQNTVNDFILRLSKSADVSLAKNANQEINIFISARFYKLKGQDEVLRFVKKIGIVSKALKIGSTHMPLALYETRRRMNRKMTIEHPLIWTDYGMPDELDFAPNPAGDEWVMISDRTQNRK